MRLKIHFAPVACQEALLCPGGGLNFDLKDKKYYIFFSLIID